MKTFTAIGVFALTLIIASVPARATDSTGSHITFGRGLQTCAAQVTTYGLHLDAII